MLVICFPYEIAHANGWIRIIGSIVQFKRENMTKKNKTKSYFLCMILGLTYLTQKPIKQLPMICNSIKQYCIGNNL